MSKYKKSDLKKMALTLVGAKNSGNFRYLEFIMVVSVKAGVSPEHVERKILEYVNS